MVNLAPTQRECALVLRQTGLTGQRLPERTSLRHRLPTTVAVKQLLGPPGQYSPDLSALALHPWDRHAVVAGRLVAHPGDDGGFGPPPDRDALRPGHGAAADRRGVVVTARASLSARPAWVGVEGQERHDRPEEVPDVLGLRPVSAAGVGCLDLWHLAHRVIRKVLSHTAMAWLCAKAGHAPPSFDRLCAA
jgi:hypothetical protein